MAKKKAEKKVKKSKEPKEMWKRFKVTMDFEYRLCGSVPLSKQIVPLWLEARKPNKKPDDAIPLEELEKEVNDSIQDTLERTTLGFQEDEQGLWLRGGTIKAHLKDCANQIKELLDIPAFKSKVANSVYIEEYKVHLRKNGTFVKSSDSSFEQPVHVLTPRGPRNALKVIHFVENPTLEFTMMILGKFNEVTIKSITRIFEYGSTHGYGGERGLGEGRYKFDIKEI